MKDPALFEARMPGLTGGYVDIAGRDIGPYVKEARELVDGLAFYPVRARTGAKVMRHIVAGQILDYDGRSLRHNDPPLGHECTFLSKYNDVFIGHDQLEPLWKQQTLFSPQSAVR